MSEPRVINAAYPFVPYELATPHFASTYVPADAQRRFLDAFGHEAVLVSGTDVQGFHVQRHLHDVDGDRAAVLDRFHRGYREQFDSFDVDFDRYGRTDDPAVRETALEAFENLRQAGYVFEDDRTVHRCEDCGLYLPSRFREPADGATACGVCGSTAVVADDRPHLFLDLPATDSYVPIVEAQRWAVVRDQLRGEARDLDPWNVTRDEYLGFDVPGRELDQGLYLWFASLAMDFELVPAEWQAGVLDGRRLTYYHHVGKNITFYQGIVAPALLEHGVGVPELGPEGLDVQIAARGFGDLDHPDLPEIERVVEAGATDYFRFYALHKISDDVSDFTLTTPDMAEFVNGTVVGRIGSLFTRCIGLLESAGVAHVPDVSVDFGRFEPLLADVERAALRMAVAEATAAVRAYFDEAHAAFDDRELWADPGDREIAFVCHLVSHGVVLLRPIMPGRAETFDVFEGVDLSRVRDARAVGGAQLTTDVGEWDYFEPD